MSEPRFTVTQSAGSLGDWLSLTPLLRVASNEGDNPLVIAQDSPHTRQFATLYQGLAEVEFAPVGTAVSATPETDEPTCFSRRILRAHGYPEANPIPYVRLTAAEIEEAEDLLAARTNVPVSELSTSLAAIAPAPGGARPDLPDNHIANYRRWPAEFTERLVDRLHSQGLLPIRFGTSKTLTQIYGDNRSEQMAGVLVIPDLTVRQVAACYSVIGYGVFTDTGDRHLMLAAGGRTELWVPPSTWFYDHIKHLYNWDAWCAAGEKRREHVHVYPREMPTQF